MFSTFAFNFILRRCTEAVDGGSVWLDLINEAHSGCLRIMELVPATASDSDEEWEAGAYIRPPFSSA
jgi:hypothetical protein